MIKTEFKLEYKSEQSYEDKMPVIIVAAGNSSRMKGTNKQLLELCGIPVIVRTLNVFEKSPLISKIILVTRKEDVLLMQGLCEEYNISKVSDITEGGKDRFSSVLNGFERLSVSDKKVLIHDGARPLVDNQIIGNVCAALQNCDAVVCAVKVKDTVKRVDEKGYVIETPERDSLYAVQTPQGVDVSLYKSAAEKISDTATVTDDAFVMENAGHRVKIVSGSYSNIKITTPDDVTLAKLFIGEED